MARLRLRSILTFVGTLPDVEKVDWVWTVPHSLGGTARVSFSPGEKTLGVEYEAHVSKELANLVGTQTRSMDGLSKPLIDEIYTVFQPELETSRRVLAHLVYTLGWSDLNADELAKQGKEGGLYWSLDGENWERAPSDPEITIGVGIGRFPLNDRNANSLQKKLSAGIEPLIARRHLHRAKDERSPRFMWIDATIAAELAVKEFLIRWNPDLGPLLLDMPSPPLYKLYGPILEAYIGERSPELKGLREGAEMRNKLVHNPTMSPPREQESWDYVGLVEQAIEHLEQHLRKRSLA